MTAKTTAPKTAPAPVVTKCRCGCGLQTIRTDAMYLPGHDARHAGIVGRAIIANPTQAKDLIAALPTDRLRIKAEAMVAKAAEREAERARRQAAREAAKTVTA